MLALVIRAAHEGDLAAIGRGLVALGEHVKAHGRGPFIQDLPENPTGSAEEVPRRHLHDENRFVLVAERDHAVIGWLFGVLGPASVGWSTRQVGRINGCWVDPPARRRGVARELVTAAEDEFRRRGADVVELAYVCGNAEAEATWRALGYRPHRVFAGKRL